MNSGTPVILLLTDWFSPGFKGGGSQKTSVKLVRWLQDRYRFKVITRNHDLGAAEPYEGIVSDDWSPVNGADVFYASRQSIRWGSMRRLIRDTPHDLRFYASFFSRRFSMQPFFLQQFDLIPPKPSVISVRGEMFPSALAQKRLRKRILLQLSHLTGMHNKVVYHYSTDIERDGIVQVMGKEAVTMQAKYFLDPDVIPDDYEPATKNAGELSLAFLSRLVHVKNLHYVLEVVKDLTDPIKLHVYGPWENQEYKIQCMRLIKSLPENITLIEHGEIPEADVIPTLSKHHLFILPSMGENFGYVVPEALAGGCPALVSDRTPWLDLEQHGAGWTVPLEEPERYREVIRTVAAMNQREFNAVSRAAREYAEQYVYDASIADEYSAIFERAMAMYAD